MANHTYWARGIYFQTIFRKNLVAHGGVYVDYYNVDLCSIPALCRTELYVSFPDWWNNNRLPPVLHVKAPPVLSNCSSSYWENLADSQRREINAPGFRTSCGQWRAVLRRIKTEEHCICSSMGSSKTAKSKYWYLFHSASLFTWTRSVDRKFFVWLKLLRCFVCWGLSSATRLTGSSIWSSTICSWCMGLWRERLRVIIKKVYLGVCALRSTTLVCCLVARLVCIRWIDTSVSTSLRSSGILFFILRIRLEMCSQQSFCQALMTVRFPCRRVKGLHRMGERSVSSCDRHGWNWGALCLRRGRRCELVSLCSSRCTKSFCKARLR